MLREYRYSKGIFQLSLFLLPFEAIKGIMPSLYRPVIVYAFLIIFLLRGRKMFLLSKRVFSYGVFCIVSIFYSWSITLIKYQDYSGVIDFSITILLGFLLYAVSVSCMREWIRKDGIEGFIKQFFNILGKVYTIPLLIGILEMGALYGFLPFSLKIIIMAVFGGNQNTRINLTTYEASWASMMLISILFVYIYLYAMYRKKRDLFRLLVSVALFIATFSLQGFLTVIIGAILCFFVDALLNNHFKKAIEQFFFFSLFIGAGILILMIILDNYTGNLYFINRMKIISQEGMGYLFYRDSSVFIRIEHIFMELIICLETWGTGIGGGNFPLVYNLFLWKYFPDAAGLPEVANILAGRAKANCNCLYARVFGELGIIGGIYFVSFVFSQIGALRRIKNMQGFQLVVIWVCMMIACPIQFGSFCYVPFWLALGICQSIQDEIKE